MLGMYSGDLGRRFLKWSEFHFITCSCAIVTYITPFSGASTIIFHLGDFKHGFVLI